MGLVGPRTRAGPVAHAHNTEKKMPPGGHMISKKKRPYDPEELAPERRLRANLGDLLARNELPGTRIAELASDVNRVQPTALRNLAGRAGGTWRRSRGNRRGWGHLPCL